MLTIKNKMGFVVMGLLFCLIVVGCGSSGESDSDRADEAGETTNTEASETTNTLSVCERAMKAAADVSDLQDTVEDIDPVIRVCGSMEEFAAASAKFPKALDGASEEIFVTNRCTYNTALQSTEICKSLMD